MKLSVIGSGRWGKTLIGKFHEVCGVHQVYGHQNREALADLGVEFTEDIDGLIAASDAVAVASPSETHYALARKVLTAGKDLFVEKPIALSSGEARELAELAEARERILMVGHVLCYSAGLEEFRALGKPVAAKATFLKPSTTEKYLNAVWNFGPHMVALALVLGVEMDRVELDCNDAAAEERREFTLTAVDDNGAERCLTWDFLAPGQREDRLRAECEHFVRCVQTRQRPLTDGWHGVQVLEVLERISPEHRKVEG